MELIVGILAIFSGLFLAYKSGAHEHDKAEWERASAQALDLVAQAGSRGRHPSA